MSLHKWFGPSLGSQPARRDAVPTFAAFAVSRFVIAGLLHFVKSGFFSNLIVVPNLNDASLSSAGKD